MMKYIRKIILKIYRKNEFESRKLRDFFLKNYGAEIGLYSYGCFDPKRIPRGTVIGRFCSFAPTCYFFNGNHPLHTITTHPYIYNPKLNVVPEEAIRRTRCVVSDDVWIGHNAVILPSVSKIGRGAIIAAGAVVTKEVPPYAVLAGNPAKVIKFRFEEPLIREIEESRWWEMSLEQLKSTMENNPNLILSPEDYFDSNKRADCHGDG